MLPSFLAGAQNILNHAPLAKRNGVRFRRLEIDKLACQAESARITKRSGVTLVPKADCLDVCEANLASLPKANVGRTVPTIREDNILPYFTFLKKYVIIISTNNFQKLFWTFSFLSV